MGSKKNKFTALDKIRGVLSIFVFFILLLFFTPFILLLLIVSFGRLSSFVVENIGPLISKPVMAVLGIKFKVKKHADSFPSPAIYIINHNSTLDVLTILALGLPRVRFVAKWEFQYNPLFFIVGRLTGQVFIRREKTDKAIATLQKAMKRIKRDRLSLMFAPEGSRNHPGIIGPFKKGPFRMAQQLEYPIVPIYFEGNRQLSEGATFYTKPGTCTAHIYPAIDTSDWTTENLTEHINEVRNRYLDWAKVHESSNKKVNNS